MTTTTPNPKRNVKPDSSESHAMNIARWINDTIKPDVFVTIPTPRCAPRSTDRYLRRWLRAAEVELYGKRSLKAPSCRRPLWLFAKETMYQRSKSHALPKRTVDKFPHVHILVSLPLRMMKPERQTGSRFSVEERCAAVQTALLNATRSTPEPFGGSADVHAQPYKPADAAYLMKQLRFEHHDHWTEHVDASLLRDVGIAILPAPRRTKAKRLPEHPSITFGGDYEAYLASLDPPARTQIINGVEYETVWDGTHSLGGFGSQHDDELLPSRKNGVRSAERFSLTRSDFARVVS